MSHDYLIVNEVRLTLRVRAENPNEAVRLARDTALDQFSVGDKDRVEVWADDGSDEEYGWDEVEALAGQPTTAKVLP